MKLYFSFILLFGLLLMNSSPLQAAAFNVGVGENIMPTARDLEINKLKAAESFSALQAQAVAKPTLKERLLQVLLKNKFFKILKDTNGNKNGVNNQTGFGAGLASVLSYLATIKFAPTIFSGVQTIAGGAALALFLSAVGLGLSIWAIIRSSRYVRQHRKDEDSKIGFARAGRILGIIGTVFWGYIALIALIIV